MSRDILLDLDNLKLVAVAEGKNSVRRLEYIAEIELPKNEFYICGDSLAERQRFTDYELKLIYLNTTGDELKTNNREQILQTVGYTIQRATPDTRDLEGLMTTLGRALGAIDPLPQPEKPGKKSTQSGAAKPVSRPKAGTTTGNVWDACDWWLSENPAMSINDKEFRTGLIKVCIENGINEATASTQFGKWKKHQLNA
jgi:hypothetical protein